MREGPAFRAFAAAPEAPVSFEGDLERLPIRVEYWFAWKRAFPQTQ
ncbi:MAG: hypothetical protein R2724_15765 [Bryobacterales bacterium]